MRPEEATNVQVSGLRGNRQFDFAVVGESHRQFELLDIVGGRTHESAEFGCTAFLIPEPDNAIDPSAIMVFIEGQKVGYLPRAAAAHYNAARCAHGVHVAACMAMIVGGWDRGEDDMGHFGVKLDVKWPFEFQDIRDWNPAEFPPSKWGDPFSTPSRTMVAGMSSAGRAVMQSPPNLVPSKPASRSIWRYIGIIVLHGCVAAGAAYLQSSVDPAPEAVATSQPVQIPSIMPTPAPGVVSTTTIRAPGRTSSSTILPEPVPLPRPRPNVTTRLVSVPPEATR